MPIHADATYISGITVQAQPYLGTATVGSSKSTTAFANDGVTQRNGVDLTGVGPCDSVVFSASGHNFATAEVNWNGTQLITLGVLNNAIAAITTNVSVVITPSIAQDSQVPGQITCKRGDTLANTLTLGTITGWSKIYWTAKQKGSDADSAAIIQVQALSAGGGGLTVLHGATAATPSQASLVVSDVSAGTVVLTLSATVTASLSIGDLYWDCEVVYPSGAVKTPQEGIFSTKLDLTQAIS